MGLMAKELKYMHNWGEVAPALVIPHEKPSNNISKLETIAEEGSESFEIMPNVVVFLFPVFLSFMTYYFMLYRQIV